MQEATAIGAMPVAFIVDPNDTRARFVLRCTFGQVDRQQLLPVDLPERTAEHEPCAGVVWVDDERNGHCPYCGGLLHIAPWPAG